MPPTRRALCASALLSMALGPLAALAQQTAYPTRTITIVVPFTAGGGVDVMARLLADKLHGWLGQQVIVENKPGASGMLGALAVVRAAADGHTLLLGSAGETAINPFIFKTKMQYAPERDLTPITGDMVHVPYRGASGQLVDVASGNVDITFVSMAAAAPFLDDGKVKAIAVTGAKRAPFAPELPAIAESKAAPTYALENWFGLCAPAATPAPVVAKINAAVVQALQDPGLAKRMTEQGGITAPMSPAQFREFIKTESAQYARIVEFARITPDN